MGVNKVVFNFIGHGLLKIKWCVELYYAWQHMWINQKYFFFVFRKGMRLLSEVAQNSIQFKVNESPRLSLEIRICLVSSRTLSSIWLEQLKNTYHNLTVCTFDKLPSKQTTFVSKVFFDWFALNWVKRIFKMKKKLFGD